MKDRTGERDASRVFIPKSKEFSATYALGDVVYLDEYATGKTHPRTVMYEKLEAARGLDVVAYFGHGITTGLPSARMRWKHHEELRDKIKIASNGPCRVILYACSAGLPGYFASTLQKKLGPSYTVFGHTCAGHSTTNPYVTRFPAVEGQEYIVKENSRLWQPWYCRLKCDKDSTLWRRFPFMTQEQIEKELEEFDYEALQVHAERCPIHRRPKKAQIPAGAVRAGVAMHR